MYLIKVERARPIKFNSKQLYTFHKMRHDRLIRRHTNQHFTTIILKWKNKEKIQPKKKQYSPIKNNQHKENKSKNNHIYNII